MTMVGSGRLLALWRGLLLVILMCSGVSGAARESARAQSANVIAAVLPNGLQYYIERLPAADRVRMTLLVGAGFYDGQPETDAAHVVEHLVAHDAMTTVAAWGGAAGRDVNASTGYTSTSYYLDLPANNPSAANVAWSILLQWASPQSFGDDAIDREIKATIEEARGTTPLMARLSDLKRQAWFEGHPLLSYRENSNGTSNATPEAVRAFHARWYRPPHLAIVVTGNVDPRAIEREIRARFSLLASGGAPNVREPIIFRLSGANHYIPFPVAETEGASINLTYKRRSPSAYRDRLEEAVAARFAAKLFEAASERLTSKYAPGVLGGGFLPSVESGGRVAGLTFMTAQFDLRAGSGIAGAREILALVEAVRQFGFPEAQIERVRAALLAEEAEADTPARAAARWAALYLDRETALSAREVRAATEHISAARINRMLSSWLAPRNRDIVFTGSPASATLPSEAEMNKLLEEAARSPGRLADEPPVRAPALPALPPPAVAGGLVHQAEFTIWSLPASGATILYRRVPGAGEVRMEALRIGGVRSHMPADRAAVIAAADVVPNSGLGGLDRFELGRYLESENIAIGPLIAETREGFRAHGPKPSLEKMLRLLRAALFAPDCRAEALEDYRIRQNEQRRAMARDSSLALSVIIASTLDLTVVPDEAAISTLSLPQLCGTYASIFADMRDFAIVVEGDLEPSTDIAKIAAALDVSPPPFQRQVRNIEARESRTGRDTIIAGEGSLATVQLVVQRASSGDDAVDGAGRVANRLIKDRLTARLRGREKGTYAVNVQTVATSRPDITFVAIQFDCDAANIDRLIAAAQDELQDLRGKPIPLQEIAAAQAMVGPIRAATLQDVAEDWLTGRTLSRRPPDPDVIQWLDRYLDPAFIHIFVRVPGGLMTASGVSRAS